MGAFIKLDQSTIRTRMGWRSAEGLGIEKPRLSNDYKAVLAGADTRFVSEKLNMVVNQKLSLLLDCTVAPLKDYYHLLLAVNPVLLQFCEVSAPTLFVPGTERVQPALHIRALRSFDVGSLDWIASLHLVD